jgi:hypothetical protein
MRCTAERGIQTTRHTRSATAPLIAIWNVIAFSGCASAPPQQLGTGDVSFRVVWDGKSDLDLHVSDPDGEHISHQHRRSATGGILDVYCNADRMCSHPVENVYWPVGQAPRGRYRVWVRAHRLQEGEALVPARLFSAAVRP